MIGIHLVGAFVAGLIQAFWPCLQGAFPPGCSRCDLAGLRWSCWSACSDEPGL